MMPESIMMLNSGHEFRCLYIHSSCMDVRSPPGRPESFTLVSHRLPVTDFRCERTVSNRIKYKSVYVVPAPGLLRLEEQMLAITSQDDFSCHGYYNNHATEVVNSETSRGKVRCFVSLCSCRNYDDRQRASVCTQYVRTQCTQLVILLGIQLMQYKTTALYLIVPSWIIYFAASTESL